MTTTDHRFFGILVLVILLCHYPVASSYLWDDRLLILENPWTKDWSHVWDIWTWDLWNNIPGEHTHHWYRPMMALHLIVDEQLFSSALLPRQIVSVLWFMGSVYLLFRFLRTNTDFAPMYIYVAITVFALHPIQAELLQVIVGRNDSMALCFVVLGLVALSNTRISIAFSAISFTLALCSKESALVWMGILGVLLLIHPQKRTKFFISAGISVVIWILLRRNAIDMFSQGYHPTIQNPTLLLAHGIGDLLSFPLHPLQPPPEQWTTSSVLWGFVLCTGIFFSRTRYQWWAIAIYVVGIELALLATQTSHTIGFRYYGLPLFGLAMWTLATLQSYHHKLHRFSSIQYSTPSVLVYVLISIGWNHIAPKDLWQDDHHFWLSGWQQYPSSYTACGYFKSIEKEAINLEISPDIALEFLHQAVSAPASAHCCFNATIFPLRLQRPDIAVTMGEYATQYCSASPELLAPWALGYAIIGDWDRAESIATTLHNDPFGYTAVILSAAALRRNDRSQLEYWAQSNGEHTPAESIQLLEAQAQQLLQSSP